MARIVYTIGEIFGSIGGLTFQRNRSGKIVRSRPTVGKKSTTKQQISHSKHQNFLSLWQSLTTSQKDEWNLYALTFQKTNKFGENKTLTGQNWFESVNYWRQKLSLPLHTSPPPHTIPPGPPTFKLKISDNDIEVIITTSFNFDENALIIWVTKPTLKITNSINQIRKLAKIATSAPLNIIDITNEFVEATGLQWKPYEIFPNTNIFVCLESVNKASGITSSMVCKKINTKKTI
jgi:hypothetical protein